MKKVNNIIRIPTSLNGKFFRFWLEFLAPFHKLTDRELDIATAFLKKRFELSKVIKDEKLLDEISMNKDSKYEIRTSFNLSPPHFQVIMGKLKKAKIIVDNKINPKFIPKNLDEDDNAFQLLLYFDLGEKSI